MRGKHATKPMEEVIAEATQLANDGVVVVDGVARGILLSARTKPNGENRPLRPPPDHQRRCGTCEQDQCTPQTCRRIVLSQGQWPAIEGLHGQPVISQPQVRSQNRTKDRPIRMAACDRSSSRWYWHHHLCTPSPNSIARSCVLVS